MTKQDIAILMYHAFLERFQPGAHPVHILQANFIEQMNWLAAQNYRTLRLDEAVTALAKGQALPERSVVLTFDDGYYSLHSFVRPLLARLGFVATLFLTTDPVDRPGYGDDWGIKAKNCPEKERPLSWAEVGELSSSGWDIEAHSCSHPYLSGLTPGALQYEVIECKDRIEAYLKVPVRYYAYPFGDYNRTVLQAVRNAGYKAACSVHTGKASGADLLRLPRIEINNRDNLERFQSKVETGYESGKERWRARVRNMAYFSPAVKDLLQFPSRRG
ncbi:MAG TPA: polysaccharide deacetylase family protein [Chloroflexia bacterium]|nr:polysaccharide deacetylase family protein [Chloroflexia bacterium]